MVRLLPRGRGGARGKLTSDPAVETAAVALLVGYANPLGLLAADRADWDIAVAVVERARDLQREQAKNLADYTAAATAAKLVPGLSRVVLGAISRALRAMS